MTNLRTERAEEVRHVDFRASDGADGQTLEGYAAVFNAWTDIRDSLGTYRERIAPGAFKRSIGQRTPVLQFDHGSHPLIGSLPLGSISVLREDRNGLFVKARLSDNWLIEPFRDAIRDGGVKGMSFRFRVIDDEWSRDADDNETRTIREVELLELGPVVFPAYEQTSVAVRSLVKALDDETRAELAQQLGYPDVEDDATTTTTYTEVVEVGEREQVLPLNDDPSGTSTGAVEPAVHDDSPDEPPVASPEPRQRIAEALARFRHTPNKEHTDVDQ